MTRFGCIGITIVAIIAIGAASFLLVQYVLPLIAPMPR